MATVQDLGKSVKAKYPGQYDDMDDAEVGRRVKSKYGAAYADFSDSTATPQAKAQPDWREQSLSALPGAFAAGGSILGGVLGTPGGPPGVAGGMLLGAGGGGYSGRVIEQYARALMGLPPAQAEIMGQPIPQGMDLPATALGYASGEAAGMGAVSGVAGAARGMASMPPQVTKAVGKFAAGRIPGLRELTDLADLGRSLKGAVAPAEKAAETVKPKLAGRIRPGTPPTAEVATPQKPLAAEPGKAAREAAVRQRTIARPQRGASGPELARRAKLFTKTAAEPAPEDMTTTLGKSLRLEQEMQKLGLTPAQKALARQAVASDPNGIGKLLGASLFGGLSKPPPDSVRINEHWRRRPGRKETR